MYKLCYFDQTSREEFKMSTLLLQVYTSIPLVSSIGSTYLNTADIELFFECYSL